MQIKQIFIRHYGMFHNQTIGTLSPNLQVFYGVNETGKTTLMCFIRDIFFGFSQRSPGIQEGSALYGGRLFLNVCGFGDVTVERWGDKGKGTVKVYFNDGTAGADEALAELLEGLDRAMFEAIFSFGLEGLQGLEKLGADDLSDYLFHAGMAGDLSIRALEKELKKKQEALFKPKGQNPRLNQLVGQLGSLQKDIQSWQKKNDHYQQVTEDIEQIRQQIASFTAAKESHKKEIRTLEKQKTLAPYIEEQQNLTLQLAQLPAYEPFPEDGLTRFDHWQTKKVELEGQLADVKTRRREAQEKLDSIDVNEEWLRYAENVRRERERVPFKQEEKNREAAYAETLQSERTALDALFSKLGNAWTEDMIQAADTGMGAKQELDNYVREREQYVQRHRLLQAEHTRKTEALKASRSEKEQLAARRLASSERQILEEKIAASEKRGRQNKEEQNALMGRRQGRAFFYTGLVFAIALALWLAVNSQWVVGIVTAVLIVSFSLYLRYTMVRASARDGPSEEAQFQGASFNEQKEAKMTLAKDDACAQSEISAEERAAQNEEACNHIIAEKEKLDKECCDIEEQIAEWCRNHRFPQGQNPETLTDVFAYVEDAKTCIRKRDRAREDFQRSEEDFKKWENHIQKLSAQFRIDFENASAALERMHFQIEQQQQQQQQQHLLQENIRDLDQQIRTLQEKMQHYQNECSSLMQQAGVDNEDAYRRKGKAWLKSRDICEQWSANQTKLEMLTNDQSERDAAREAFSARKEDIDSQILQLENDIKSWDQQERDLYGELANLKTQKSQLEEGGTYAELYHRFKQNQDLYQEEAHRWMVYRTAEDLLKRAKARYRNEREPKIIAAASRYFATMTEGHYPFLFAPKEDGFIVERTDGRRFSPDQLSRGTVEQLYVAIRLALAENYQSSSPYPLIMDDILANFDAARAVKSVGAIREIAAHHQVLFFTCHRHLLKQFGNHEILSMENDRAFAMEPTLS